MFRNLFNPEDTKKSIHNQQTKKNFIDEKKFSFNDGSASPTDFSKKNSFSKIKFGERDMQQSFRLDNFKNKTNSYVSASDKKSISPDDPFKNKENISETFQGIKPKKSSNVYPTTIQKNEISSFSSLLHGHKELIGNKFHQRSTSPVSPRNFLGKKKVQFQKNDLDFALENKHSSIEVLNKSSENLHPYYLKSHYHQSEHVLQDENKKQSYLKEKNKASGHESKYFDYLLQDPKSISISDTVDIDKNFLSKQKDNQITYKDANKTR